MELLEEFLEKVLEVLPEELLVEFSVILPRELPGRIYRQTRIETPRGIRGGTFS